MWLSLLTLLSLFAFRDASADQGRTADPAASGPTFKVAAFNIRSGRGFRGFPGRPCSFEDSTNCTDASQPLNAWGRGVVQQELMRHVGNDQSVVALVLAEAWLCGNPENVRKALGWKKTFTDRNGVSMVARHGIVGDETWQQLDTSANPNPKDTKWVVGARVCLDAGCKRTMMIYGAHWYAAAGDSPVYDVQARQTVEFLERLPAGDPRVLIGDLNAYEEPPVKCAKDPHPTALQRLRAAGYTDTWKATSGAANGFTGMLNRAGCGEPEGAPFKRPDYAWSRNLVPVSMTRFGVVPPGECSPSDHLGIIAEYRLPVSR